MAADFGAKLLLSSFVSFVRTMSDYKSIEKTNANYLYFSLQIAVMEGSAFPVAVCCCCYDYRESMDLIQNLALMFLLHVCAEVEEWDHSNGSRILLLFCASMEEEEED